LAVDVVAEIWKQRWPHSHVSLMPYIVRQYRWNAQKAARVLDYLILNSEVVRELGDSPLIFEALAKVKTGDSKLFSDADLQKLWEDFVNSLPKGTPRQKEIEERASPSRLATEVLQLGRAVVMENIRSSFEPGLIDRMGQEMDRLKNTLDR